MRVEINLSNLKYKFLISLVVLCLFYVIYCTIPHSEFGQNDQTVNKLTTFERINYTIERHVFFSTRNSIYPITTRGQILTLAHTIIAWCILVL